MVETEYDHVRPVDDEHVSETVLRAIDTVSDRSLLDLPPLQEFIDVDTLDLLFASSSSVQTLRFTYDDFEILVEPTRVHVRHLEPQSPR